MCKGTATKLLCSHYLIHWSGPRCPKRCVLPERRVALACTCAPCDPSFNQSQILRRHEDERDLLLARIREAWLEGRLADARQLEGQLRLSAVSQMQELGRAARVGSRGGGVGGALMLDPAVGCQWPGMYEQWVTENLGRDVDWDLLLSR